MPTSVTMSRLQLIVLISNLRIAETIQIFRIRERQFAPCNSASIRIAPTDAGGYIFLKRS